jgi:propanediol dehydratase small subunit
MRASEERYPLIDNAADRLHADSGRNVSDIDLEALCAGQLSADDLRISAEALREQAAIAEDAGYVQVAQNLRRAAELTAVPNEELLRIYEALRPGRSTYAEMRTIAQRLQDEYRAPETAAFVFEAAEVYRQRGFTRQE